LGRGFHYLYKNRSLPGTAGTTEDALKPPPAVLPPSPLHLPEYAQGLPGLWGELHLRPPIQGGRDEEPRDWGAGKPQRAKQGIRARRFPVEKE